MKNLKIFVISLLLIFGLVSCKKDNAQVTNEPQSNASIDTLMMSEDSVNAYLAKIMNGYVLTIRHQLLADTSVLKTISETQAVIQDIEQKNTDKAQGELNKLIGKLDVYLTKNPNAALIPIDVSYRKVETIDDIDSVRTLAKTIKKMVDKGYYQGAKGLLQGMTSEMIVTTAYIPVVDYLQGLRYAATLLDENKPDKAMVLMQQTLSSVVLTSVSIPLPVLKAQIFVDKAASLYKDNHENWQKKWDTVNVTQNLKNYIKLLKSLNVRLKIKKKVLKNSAT